MGTPFLSRVFACTHIVMVYIVMPYIVMAYIVMDYIVTAYIAMACIVMDYIAMAYIGMRLISQVVGTPFFSWVFASTVGDGARWHMPGAVMFVSAVCRRPIDLDI